MDKLPPFPKELVDQKVRSVRAFLAQAPKGYPFTLLVALWHLNELEREKNFSNPTGTLAVGDSQSNKTET